VALRQDSANSGKHIAYPVAVGVAAFALWMLLEPFAGRDFRGSASNADPTTLPPVWAIVWLAFRAVGSIVTVPLAEELAFRGYLLRRLSASDFSSAGYERTTWVAVFASSAAFGLLHGRWLAGTLVGMLYAHAAIRGGHWSHAALAHATTNLLITIFVCSTGQWSQWS
jgi:CAAX prenyl protease-like protein